MQDHFGLLTRILLPKVAQELKEPHIAWEVDLAEASKHPQVWLQQGEQTLRPILMHLPTGIFLLRMIDMVMNRALQRPIAAGRIGIYATARLDRQVRRLLDRLHREISGRLDHHCPLATDPGDDGRPIFVIMAPTGLALLTTPTRAAPQVLYPSVFGLALLASGVIEIIGFNGPCQLPLHFIGQGSIPQPPAPAVAGPDMHPQLSGNPPRRA